MKVPGESFVPNKILGLEPRPARVTPASGVRPPAAATSGKGEEQSGADVRFTDSARKLAALEESLRALPAVDELRVAAVKQRLQDGTYEIDPQRIADRLLRMEADLAKAAPFDPTLK
jgi:negative regulator of flagellin synthesis FlgM